MILRNGATLLAMASNRRGEAVVLAERGDMFDSQHPYMTWGMNMADDSTFWGHYFKTRDEAEADFDKRKKGLGD